MAALTAVARRLTEAHRLAQLGIASSVTASVSGAWELLDIDDLDASTDAWLSVVSQLVQGAHTRSAGVASRYLSAFRAVEAPDAVPFDPVVPDGLVDARVTASMLVTGPIAVKSRLSAGMRDEQAMMFARLQNAGASMRLALDGGRDTIVDTTRADPAARGYERVTSGNACDWCVMLAGRGAVYHSAESAGDGDAWHDHCGCSAEPVYGN
jgi:hypothetical protein